MKSVFVVIIALLLVNCNSTQLKETWKNPEITSYAPSKVFIIGITSNLEARQKFETKLKDELEIRGIEAVRSLDVLDPSLKTKRITESEMDELEADLLQDGFDTILLSKIIGVEDKIVYKKDYDDYDETYTKFREDYLKYQDIFYNPDYYDEYSIYHAETSMHCICPSADRSLIWKGYIDILDPKSGDNTITNYVNIVIAVLEDQMLISPISFNDDTTKEEVIN